MLKSIFYFFVTLIALNAFGQNTTSSPFSYFGLGENSGIEHGTFGALGNATAANFDSTVLNYYNPASYNTLSKNVPLFSFGISNRLSIYREQQTSSLQFTSALQHFAMAFPIKDFVGFSFGFKPYSSKGYQMYADTAIGVDTLTHEYSGKGNTQDLFFGLSTYLLKKKNTRISVGGNVSYLFGGTENYRRSYFKSDVPSTNVLIVPGGVELTELRLNTFHYDLGAYFWQRINDNQDVTIGFTMEPYQEFNAKISRGIFYSTDIYNLSSTGSLDTLYYQADTAGIVSNIPNMSFGLKYNFKFQLPGDRMNKMESLLSVHLNYRMADWGAFRNDFDSINTFEKSSTLSFGVQFIPTHLTRQVSNIKYWKRIQYRAGMYSSKLPYSVNGSQLSDFGTTFGIGLPFKRPNAPISMVSIAFNIGNRGNGIDTDLNETYYGINLGINIAPSFDLWFKKYKLN